MEGAAGECSGCGTDGGEEADGEDGPLGYNQTQRREREALGEVSASPTVPPASKTVEMTPISPRPWQRWPLSAGREQVI